TAARERGQRGQDARFSRALSPVDLFRTYTCFLPVSAEAGQRQLIHGSLAILCKVANCIKRICLGTRYFTDRLIV
ncbi:hypothetical protein CHS0354_033691, partial [Potamilus streckersoni]